MHEVGEESRRRSYATVILTVDATLNMYMRHAAKRDNQRLSTETGASSGSCEFDTVLERFSFRTHRREYINILATIFCSKKRNIREIDIL